MRGRRAFPASTVPRKPQQQKMRICSIAKGPLKERAFLLAYEMASGNLKHCARVGRDQGGSIKGANVFSFNPRARQTSNNTMFQSTRPRGARPWIPCLFDAGGMFQSTRPRGARRGVWINRALIMIVSIHAPARGATQPLTFPMIRTKFQSTRPRGARLVKAYYRKAHIMFQSTRPRGARPAPSSGKLPLCEFQSTRPRGARL